MRAVAELYHRYLTGILLALVQRHGTARAAEVAFRTFRRQHLEKFLPGPAASWAWPTCPRPSPAPSTTTCRTRSVA